MTLWAVLLELAALNLSNGQTLADETNQAIFDVECGVRADYVEKINEIRDIFIFKDANV